MKNITLISAAGKKYRSPDQITIPRDEKTAVLYELLEQWQRPEQHKEEK